MDLAPGPRSDHKLGADLAGLAADREERTRVSYVLQMSLHATANRAEINDITAVSNPRLNLRFQKRTSNLAVIECWVDVDKLDSQNSLSSLVSQGFTIGQKGMTFTHGSIGIPHYSNTSNKQYVLCKVAIGVPFVMPESEVYEKSNHESGIVIPDGYNSIYLHPGEPGADSEQGLPSTETLSPQRFLLTNSELILPTFVVSCNIKSLKGENTEICNACESSRAVVYCQADNASLCEHCDRSMHSANKVLTKHKRIPISDKPVTKFGKCTSHPEQMLTHYCHQCQVPVCISCKMIGSHCSGEASIHKLTVIKEAYELAVMASSKEDPFLVEQKTGISKRKSQLNKRLTAVNQNYKNIEAEIRTKADEAIATLKAMTNKKISVILAENVDLDQQMLKIKWLEEFLKAQQMELPPVEFLEAWAHHVKYRRELHHSPRHSGVNRSSSVHPDLDVEGTLSIVSKPYYITEEVDEDIVKPKSKEIWNDDVLQKEKLIRDDLLRDLDSDIASARPASPAGSISSIYSVAQSLAHSISNGVAAPGGRSLKELIAVYESGLQDDEGRRSSSVPRHHPRRPALRHRYGLRTEYSPAPFGTTKRGPNKEWVDIWANRPRPNTPSR